MDQRHIITGLFLGILAGCLAPAGGQDRGPAWQWAAAIEVEAKYFTTDKLQQLYVVTPRNEVIKYGPDGREQFRYNNNTLGQLTCLDATNPFNLLLYYPDYQSAVTLDRTLNKIGEFSLWELDVVNVGAVAMASDNALWVFDNGAYHLKKVDQNGKVLLTSDNLSLLLNAAPSPLTLLARDNFVYANDPALGILVFDNFGQYIRTLPIPAATDVQMAERRLIYRREGELFIFDLETLLEAPLPLPEGVAANHPLRLEKDFLFVLRPGKVDIYRR